MKYSVSIIYVAFFSLIGFAIFYTNSAYPLFALLLTPSYNDSNNED